MQEEDQVTWSPIHKSLIRPDLIFGCERTPLVLIICVAFIFIVILQKPLLAGYGLLVAVIGIPILRKAAKRDPLSYRILIKHFGYKSHYNAHPGLSRPPPRVNISPGSIIEQQRKKGHTA